MNTARTALLHWLEQKNIPASSLQSALRLVGIPPTANHWHTFFDALLLWLASAFCALGILFFFAYNWQAIGELAKFALLEAFIIGSLYLCWRLDLNANTGKAALFFAALLIGALFALVGQTYQTGADTYELFTLWAMAILPWVAVSRCSALWLFCLALINLAVLLYYQTFGGLFAWLFDVYKLSWLLFALNTLAWAVRDAVFILTKLDWLQERWTARVLAVASGSMVTTMAIMAIFDAHDADIEAALWVYPLWLMLIYGVYRHILLDVFVLAGGVLSSIVFISVWLSDTLLAHNTDEAGVFLLIGLVIIGLSALGGFWLKSVAQQEQA